MIPVETPAGHSRSTRQSRHRTDERPTFHRTNNYIFRLLVKGAGPTPTRDQVAAIKFFASLLAAEELPRLRRWDVIEGLLPRLEEKGRFKPKRIRRCLWAAGHLLAARGKLEPWETHLARRQALAPIANAPGWIREELVSYARWLPTKQFTYRAVRTHTETLSEFWTWAAGRGVDSIPSVTSELAGEHQYYLLCAWVCPACTNTSPHDPADRDVPSAGPRCAGCGAALRRRLSHDTVRHKMAHLSRFFDWAVLTGRATSNPISTVPKIPRPNPSLTTYPNWAVEKLEDYIREPETPSLHVLVLYLIIYHAFSVEEMQRAKMPNGPGGDAESGKDESVAKTLGEIYGVELDELPVSRGRHHRGRHGHVQFLQGARSFILPKLEGYEKERGKRAKCPDNRYLLVTARSGGRVAVVSKRQVANIVAEAARAALGGHCSAEMLEKTAALIIARTTGAKTLSQLGWGGKQNFNHYSGHPGTERRVVNPAKRGKKVQGVKNGTEAQADDEPLS